MTVTATQDETVQAITQHHAQLALAVAGAAVSVRDAADRLFDPGRHRDEFVALMRGEILPHAAAEERTLYAAAADGARTALLVEAMTGEHGVLTRLVDDLAAARTPVAMAAQAQALRVMFEAHLVKENDLLLPALVAAGVDLPRLLDGMHEILGPGAHHTHQASGHHDCGCSCGHDEPAAGGLPATESGDLDLRSLPHGLRHEQVFAAADRLAPGEAFVLANDHDPKPLHLQMQARDPGKFGWTYLVAGPELWRIRIDRTTA